MLSLVLVFALASAWESLSAPTALAQLPAADDDGQTPPKTFPPLGSGADDADAHAQPVEPPPPKSPFGPPPGAKRLSRTAPIWVDLRRKALFVDGRVAVREGPPLEMFACPAHTKEHESVVAVDAEPRLVHAALLALGAEAGHPVRYEPYRPATGTKVDIIVQWQDADGRSHKMPAQQWVRRIATKKALAHPWVFGGSGFWKDEKTGESGYKADSGDFICVSNFDTATLDLPVASTQANADLLFEAFTEHIPPQGTPVRLVLRPRLHEMPLVDQPAEGDDQPPKEETAGSNVESRAAPSKETP